MADFAQLARGLLTLEINTVQKDGMSAQKMPTAANALIEVAQAYWMFLCGKAQDFGPIGESLEPWAAKLSRSFDWAREPFPQDAGAGDRPVKEPQSEPVPPGHNGEFLQSPPDTVNVLTFDHLREIAAWLSEMQVRTIEVARNPGGKLGREVGLTTEERDTAQQTAGRFKSEERSVLHRIRRNADQFKCLLDAIDPSVPEGAAAYGSRTLTVTRSTPEERFTSSHLVDIRKAWDIGTEIVLMQTVIQIDGDVVNRFQAGIDTSAKAPLHSLHVSAVDVSLRYWRWLVDAMSRLAGKAVSTLLN